MNLFRVFITGICLLPASVLGQGWSILFDAPPAGFRHDDLFFTHPDTGWVVNVDGFIYQTRDGGINWQQMLYQPETSFRCVGFADARRGWAGNLGPGAWSPTTDTIPLYRTLDGGVTWQPVTTISGPMPKGICGIQVVTDSVIYAVGRVGGPSYILTSTDGGETWVSRDFNAQAFLLIDCYFFSPDTGIVVGSTGTSWADERYAIFYTTDGAQTWQTVASNPDFNGHGWKISFPSRYTGYVSVETAGSDSVPVLKTTDGGLTWTETLWDPGSTFAQGIGFINDSTGWCGSATTSRTTDGGSSWTTVPFVYNFNRFRRIGTVAYASGQRIWKYTGLPPLTPVEPVRPDGFSLGPNYPNPFSATTRIPYTLPYAGEVSLRLYDLAGRPVQTLVQAWQPAGTYEAEVTLPYHGDTHFFCTLRLNEHFLGMQMLMKGTR